MEGDRGARDREKREREVYERRVKRGREVYERRVKRGGKWDSQGGRKREKKEKNYATFCNVSQSKKFKEAGANKYRAGIGIKEYGRREA